MRVLLFLVGVFLVAACSYQPHPPVSLTPPGGTVSVSVPAQTLESIRLQAEVADREARAAQAAIVRECSQPNAHELRCSSEPLPGSLRRMLADEVDHCNRLVDDYNAKAKNGAIAHEEIVRRVTANSQDPGHPITCDGSK